MYIALLFKQWLGTLLTCNVRTVTSVDFDQVAFINEERNANLCTSFHSSWFSCVSSSVAFHAWLGVSNLKHHFHRNLHGQDGVGCRVDGSHHILSFLEEIHTFNHVLIDVHLFESLVVHENEVVTLLIEVLELTVVNLNILQLSGHNPSTLKHTSVLHVPKFSSHHCVTFSWLNVQKVDNHIDTTIQS